MCIEARLRERAEAMTTMLSESQWNPSRSHVETLRNYMSEGADKIKQLQASGKNLERLYAGALKDAERDLAEIDRLRAALEAVAKASDHDWEFHEGGVISKPRLIARRAVEQNGSQ